MGKIVGMSHFVPICTVQSDYEAVNVALNFNSYTVEQNVHLTIVDDSIIENDEIIILELSALNNSISTELLHPAGIIVIIDDDTAIVRECLTGEVRLAGGSEEEGRIEICLDGRFSSICYDHWDGRDAVITCTQLRLDSYGTFYVIISAEYVFL